MRQRSFGIIATTTIFVALGGAAYALQAGQYRNIAGKVTGSYATGIKGSFRVEPVTAPTGLASPPSGGACLVFRAKDLGFKKMWAKVCTNDDDCTTAGESDYGYCHLPSQKCWSKPVDPPPPSPASNGSDKALCLRSIPGSSFPPPIPINKTFDISATPAQVSTPSWHIRDNAKARVLTCLNGIPGGGCARVAGAPKPAYEWGPVTKL